MRGSITNHIFHCLIVFYFPQPQSNVCTISTSLSLSLSLSKNSLYVGSIWIPLIAENWKHYSKIIFKCVNSVVGPIFNESFVEKRGLWVPWTVHRIHYHTLDAAEKKKFQLYPNVHIMSCFINFPQHADIFTFTLNEHNKQREGKGSSC